MGLDWLAGGRAKPGYEARFREIVAKVVAGEEVDSQTKQEFENSYIPAWASVGAPRVGEDEIASAWRLAALRGHPPQRGSDCLEAALAAIKKPNLLTAEEIAGLEASDGLFILELAPASDGIPVYTNAPLTPNLELTDFRGEFLRDCEEAIGTRLLEEAWCSKLPEHLVSYGNQLISKAREWAVKHRCTDCLERRSPPDAEEDSPETIAHITSSAGRWCLYWGSRHHWLEVWF